MTVHYLSKREPNDGSTPHKRKMVAVIAALCTGGRWTISALARECEITPHNVMSTIKLLEEYGLIRFAGWGERSANDGAVNGGGRFPTTWEWVCD